MAYQILQNQPFPDIKNDSMDFFTKMIAQQQAKQAQQKQDQSLRQAAGQELGINNIPEGVMTPELFGNMLRDRNKPIYAGDPLKQIELENILQNFRRTTEPPVSNTLSSVIPQETPETVPPMFIPGKKNKYGIPEDMENPAFSLYQESQREKMKPPTDAQSTSALYATRMEEADKIFDKFPEVDIKTAISGTPIVPNFMKSEQAQSMEQAKRNFLNAILRKESGAVISPSEFKQGNLQYFPVHGDKPETLLLKKQNRATAIEGVKKSAGKAYTNTSKTFNSEQEALASGYKGEAIINGRRARID